MNMTIRTTNRTTNRRTTLTLNNTRRLFTLNIDPNKLTPAELTKDMVSEAHKEWSNTGDTARKAAKAYFDDLEQRKAALQKQADEYRAQIEKWRGQRKALATKVIDLSSRGLIDKAAEVDARMEKLDNKISTTERKLRLVDAAEPKGDPKLYQAAKTAMEAMAAEETQFNSFVGSIATIANAEKNRLSEITALISNLRCYGGGHAQNAAADFKRVDRHFRELDRLEREARERYNAEQAAKKNQ